jgi:hypothetical protein
VLRCGSLPSLSCSVTQSGSVFDRAAKLGDGEALTLDQSSVQLGAQLNTREWSS